MKAEGGGEGAAARESVGLRERHVYFVSLYAKHRSRPQSDGTYINLFKFRFPQGDKEKREANPIGMEERRYDDQLHESPV